jgi:hypothetical protein
LWSGPKREDRCAIDERLSAVGTSARSWRVDGGLFLMREFETEGEMDEGGEEEKEKKRRSAKDNQVKF